MKQHQDTDPEGELVEPFFGEPAPAAAPVAPAVAPTAVVPPAPEVSVIASDVFLMLGGKRREHWRPFLREHDKRGDKMKSKDEWQGLWDAFWARPVR